MFVVLEGLDGSGTTTQLNNLSQIAGITTTKEPYQGPTHDLIRKILSGEPSYQDYRSSMTWLYMADRKYHLENFVEPNLLHNFIVISDRYIPSTMAYQSEIPELTPTKIYEMHKLGGFRIPDLLVYVRTPVMTCLERMSSRSVQEIFETEKFLIKVSERYETSLEILKQDGWNILEIDGLLSPNQITHQIRQQISDLIFD